MLSILFWCIIDIDSDLQHGVMASKAQTHTSWELFSWLRSTSTTDNCTCTPNISHSLDGQCGCRRDTSIAIGMGEQYIHASPSQAQQRPSHYRINGCAFREHSLSCLATTGSTASSSLQDQRLYKSSPCAVMLIHVMLAHKFQTNRLTYAERRSHVHIECDI